MNIQNHLSLAAVLLGTSFVVLKLTKVIDWSWWYVTMPFYATAVLFVIAVIIYALFQMLIIRTIIKPNEKKEFKEVTAYKERKKKYSKFHQKLEAIKKKQNQ